MTDPLFDFDGDELDDVPESIPDLGEDEIRDMLEEEDDPTCELCGYKFSLHDYDICPNGDPDDYDNDMDGDLASGLASAGFGMDEDYIFGNDIGEFDDY